MTKRWLLLACAALLARPALALAAADTTDDPTGDWRTFDDKTGVERSVIRIEQHNGILTGRVVSTVIPGDGARLCEKCSGDRKDQKVLGLQIIRGMRRDGDEWSGGTVLDPETGSVYRGTIRLDAGRTRLVLRGYIGISLFGRSQTWVRKQP